MFSFFKKEVIKFFPVPEYIIFNVDNFNAWFNAPGNNAIYAHSGIFLRLDKLSESHITDYLEKCYGIKNNGPFLWSKPTHIMISNFYSEIRKDWSERLNKV